MANKIIINLFLAKSKSVIKTDESVLMPQKILLRALGFPFKPIDTVGWKLLSWFHSVSLAIIVIPEICYVIDNRSKMSLVTNAMCTILYCYMSLPKIVSLQLQRKRLYRLLNELDDLWVNASDSSREILADVLRWDSLTFSIFFTTNIVVGTMYLVFPLANGHYHTWKYGNATWEMPMKSVFPYDVQQSPAYELTYLWFCHGTVAAVLGTMTTDTLFYGCVVYISGHFKVIQSQIKSLQNDQNIGTNFARLIRYQSRIIDAFEDFNAIASPILFIQFSVASLQLCVVAFQMTLPFDSYFTMVLFVLFLPGCCFQTYIYCQAGSLIITESSAVADAVYAIKWYDFSPQIKSTLQFVIMRSQPPLALKTKFFEANLFTFSSIFTTAGSYITLLQTLSD